MTRIHPDLPYWRILCCGLKFLPTSETDAAHVRYRGRGRQGSLLNIHKVALQWKRVNSAPESTRPRVNSAGSTRPVYFPYGELGYRIHVCT